MGSGLKILIVEDEIIAAEGIQSILTDFGYSVVGIVPSGKEAIEKIEELNPDLLLLDIKLRGGMNGIEVARRIREYHDIPVIYITALSDESTLQKAKKTEPYGYILKPVKAYELHTAIEISYHRYQYDKRLRETEIERSKAYIELDQIFNSTSAGMCVIDRDFNITRVNRRFLHLFNFDENSVIGNKCYTVWNENICLTEGCALKRILAGKQIVEYETEKSINDNISINCIVSAVPFKNPDGKIIGSIINFTDVTEERNLQSGIMQIIEKERQRIGQDLHDGLGQDLTSITFLVEYLKKMTAKDESPELPGIDEISSRLQDAIGEAHSIARGLCPVNMERDGLVSALEEMAEDTERVFRISCRTKRKGHIIIDDLQVATHLYYIAQESVNNAIKHGRAKNILIDIISDKNNLIMTVKDDGSGMTEKKNEGLGLRIMQYRARMVGADFKAENTRDGGFIVTVQINRVTADKS